MSGPIKWTEAQLRVLNTAGRSLLVAASAGTGKTAVLSGYCLGRICDRHNPVDADKLLVLTFTEAAADQMRSRIEQMLRQACTTSGSARLKRQLLLLDGAAIGTIHSFCRRIVAEHFYLLGIDAGFGILDPDRQRLLKTQALEDTLEQAWNSPELAAAMGLLFSGRNLNRGGFAERIIGLSEYLDGIAGRQRFYQRSAALADAAGAAGGELAAQQTEILRDKLHKCRLRLEYAASLDRLYTQGTYLGGCIGEKLTPAVRQCLDLVEQGRLEGLGDILQAAAGVRLSGGAKTDKEIAERINEPVKQVKKTLRELSGLVIVNPEYQKLLSASASGQTRTMLRLLEMFDRQYEGGKRRLGLLDFADLEHFMLKLLEDRPEVAAGLAGRFEQVLVDEYQDINAVGQAILEKLCRSDNMFVVGDVKQSIYAFRQARPQIFLDRLSQASQDPSQNDGPLRIDLADNFRSRPQVLDFVNLLFGRIMRPSLGGVDYDDRARLKAGFEYRPFGQDERAVEMYWLNEDSDGPEQEGSVISAVQRQAAFIAGRIRQMVGADGGKPQFEIYDRQRKIYRGVRYGDIVILMRSMAGRAGDYVEILRLAGIPVDGQSACGYLAATEITDMLCLLKVLDNPLRDIELAGVLRSVLFNFSDTDLAVLAAFGRAADKEKRGFFHEILCDYAGSGPAGALREKCSGAICELSQRRTEALRGSLSGLVDNILRQKHLLSIVSALPNGSQRRANLAKLYDRAVQFERFSSFGGSLRLGRFVEFLEQMMDADQDWAPAQPDSLAGDCVRIMSVHRSKGLEFPVVFAAELNAPFNHRSSFGQCLIDEQTIGLELIDAGGGRFPSLAHQVISERQRRIDRDEEMRILYVAATRARERLILTAGCKQQKCLNLLRRCRDVPHIADWDIGEAGSHFEWILYALGSINGFADSFDEDSDGVFDNELFTARRVDRGELNELSRRILRQKCVREEFTGSVDAGAEAIELYNRLKETIGRRYPYPDIASVGAKISVTELTHSDDEFSILEPPSFDAVPAAVSQDGRGPGRVQALRTGSAVHLIFERLDLQAELNDCSVKNTIAALVQQQLISPAAAEIIDVGDILAFFRSEPGRLALRHPGRTLREWPFTYALDSRRLGAEHSEIVVLQGIVDLIVQTEQGLFVVDFKTDRLADRDRDERISRYARQIDLYCSAAAAVLRTTVAGAWIYFVPPRQAVAVNLQTFQGRRQKKT